MLRRLFVVPCSSFPEGKRSSSAGSGMLIAAISLFTPR
ncbi:hypothetical protein LINPERPRIM_LOCUS5615 [Linum perenne]